MDGNSRRDTVERLKSIHGHLRGTPRMAEEGAHCIGIIRQIQAMQAALDKVSGLVLKGHLGSCLVTAVCGDDPGERERVPAVLSEVLRAKGLGTRRS